MELAGPQTAVADMKTEAATIKHAQECPARGELDRERLCNDLVNTGVMAALIGGFAFSKIDRKEIGKVENNHMELLVYVANVFAVHACTCSCLMSAFLYTKANGLNNTLVTPWVITNEWLLPIPLYKFVGGTVCYLVSVVCGSYHDLEESNAHAHALAAAL